MKSAIARLIITVLAAVLLAETCYAQTTGGPGSGGGRKQHQQKADKPAAQTPKADEKAYTLLSRVSRINRSILGRVRAESAGRGG